MIPQNNPLANYLSHQAAIDLAIHQVSKSGSYILGEETAAFEREFAEYAGVKYAVGVGNGTEALHLALRALGVGPGDEVITVSHTAVATVAAIEMTGAEPVFADIDPNSFTIAPKEVEKAITGRTKVILPVHLYGHPADLRPLLECAKQHDLYLLEDCAQAHGAVYHGRKVGSWGDAGAFSFYPTKNLGCLGDGGAVTTSSPELHERLLALRQYGWDRKRISLEPGFNSRLDELQAAILRVKLKYLNENNQKRMGVARAYDQA
ncbi:MAG: DegT/DnrJ/EryC1/StrS family aminotransferase, partial [Pseudomonadota bacterium]